MRAVVDLSEGEEVRSVSGGILKRKKSTGGPWAKTRERPGGQSLGGGFFLGNEPRPTAQERRRLAGEGLCMR
jgi:hypothetical protein